MQAAAVSAPANSGSRCEPLLEIRAVAKRFGTTRVLASVSLEIDQGEFLTILGASGSGKTTLLRLVAGFEHPDEGEIWMAGERLDTLLPYRRRVNTVFQHYALFPHLSVFENVAYGLRVRKVNRADIPERVKGALAMVKMGDFAARSPSQLSGGQQQRIALARALVNRPRLLLLDEPLSALDANLRRQMQIELKSLQREVGISFLFVTHDQEEAMALSDRIALLRAGQLEQVSTPQEIYNRPASAYTAQFVGQTNLLRGRVEQGWTRCGLLAWRVAVAEGPAVFSLRPESIRLRPARRGSGTPGGLAESALSPHNNTQPPCDDTVCFTATIRHQIFGGATDLLEITCADGTTLLARIPSRSGLQGEHEFEFSADDAVPVREE